MLGDLAGSHEAILKNIRKILVQLDARHGRRTFPLVWDGVFGVLVRGNAHHLDSSTQSSAVAYAIVTLVQRWVSGQQNSPLGCASMYLFPFRSVPTTLTRDFSPSTPRSLPNHDDI